MKPPVSNPDLNPKFFRFDEIRVQINWVQACPDKDDDDEKAPAESRTTRARLTRAICHGMAPAVKEFISSFSAWLPMKVSRIIMLWHGGTTRKTEAESEKKS